MPGVIDLVLAVIIGVVYPVVDALVIWPRMLRTLRSGAPGARVRVFREIIMTEWVPSVVVAAMWWWWRRPWSGLWLTAPAGWRVALGLLIIGLAAWLLAWMLRGNLRRIAGLTDEKRQSVRARQAGLDSLAPRTRDERMWFVAVSLTAGICEELLYRGFLVWALRPWLGLWGAALASVVSFGFAHVYQGRARAVGAGVTGAVLGALAIGLGWLVPGMVIHALVDMTSGEALYALFREPAPKDARSGSSPAPGEQVPA